MHTNHELCDLRQKLLSMINPKIGDFIEVLAPKAREHSGFSGQKGTIVRVYPAAGVVFVDIENGPVVEFYPHRFRVIRRALHVS